MLTPCYSEAKTYESSCCHEGVAELTLHEISQNSCKLWDLNSQAIITESPAPSHTSQCLHKREQQEHLSQAPVGL